jgi:glycosyltransferase involved in cell wall biosynthesis
LIAVIIPVHNEEAVLPACLHAVARSMLHSGLKSEDAATIVVLDCCTDQSSVIAQRLGAQVINVDARNVGFARRAGAELALKAGARWLAFTDADTLVSPPWLAAQLAHADAGADAVCGTISVDDWAACGARMAAHFAATYIDRDGHRHIHGANLGVSAEAYLRAGGFEALESSEDVAFVAALERTGANIAWSAMPRVSTSVRRDFRAPRGFGQTLYDIDANQLWATI